MRGSFWGATVLVVNILLILTAVTTAQAQSNVGQSLGRLYVSASPSSYDPVISAELFVPFTVYLVAEIDYGDINQAGLNASVGPYGYEAAVEIPVDIVVTGTTIRNESLNLGTDRNLIVGLFPAILADETPIDLVEYTLLPINQGMNLANIEITLGGSTPSSFSPAVPGFFENTTIGECTNPDGTPAKCLRPFARVDSAIINPSPSRIYVDADATGQNSGVSWVDAFVDLQDALAIAASGSEIWVAAGMYRPTSLTDRSISFELVNGVRVYGGFAATETDRSQRDWVANVTTLGGDIGTPGSWINGSYHVVVATSNDHTAVLDGFTIAFGNAEGTGDANSDIGAGVFMSNGAPTLANLSLATNYAVNGGGGMAIVETSAPILTNVNFLGNVTTYTGGGLLSDNSVSYLEEVRFTNNHATILGGGFYNSVGSDATLVDVTFTGNTGDDLGGGLVNESAATLTDTQFVDNHSLGYGGGILNYGTLVLTNALFSGNGTSGEQFQLGGAGIYNTGVATVMDATFSANSANHYGGAIHNAGGDLTLINSILWGNSAPLDGNELYNTATATIDHCDIRGSGGSGPMWDANLGNDLGGNLDADPLFMDIANADLHLAPCSPAIDAGDSTAIPSGVLTDLDGNPRIQEQGIDLGAYESGHGIGPFVLYVDSAASGGGGTSWPTAMSDLQKALRATETCPGNAEIWVAEGTYKPGTGTDRTDTFEMRSGVAVYGGFAGSESIRAQRDWNVNVTVLDGAIGEPDVDPYEVGDDVYHVVMAVDVDSTQVLDGFTVRYGHSSDGGGIYIADADPTLENLIITNNISNFGGGVNILGASHPVFRGVSIRDNRALQNGGGVCASLGSRPMFDNVEFRSNIADYGGGGMCGTGDFYHVQFVGNVADENAGALQGGGTLADVDFLGNTSYGLAGTFSAAMVGNGILTDVRFVGNECAELACSGGLIGGGVLTNVVFKDNVSFGAGGMWDIDGGSTVSNVVFTNNSGTWGSYHAGPKWPYTWPQSQPPTPLSTLTNVTFGGNEGGAVASENAPLRIVNCILWANTDSAAVNHEVAWVGVAPEIAFSMVQGSGGSGSGWDSSLGIDVGGNMDAPPQFVDGGAGDLRLTIGSPAMNAGDSSALPTGVLTDLDGNPRVVGDAVDMGAYELLDQMQITTIADVGNDQGRRVRIGIDGSSLDTFGSAMPVLQYEAFRRIDPLPKDGQGEAPIESEISLSVRVDKARAAGMISSAKILEYGWDYAGAIPAHARPTYDMLADTLADSTVQGMHWSVFFVRAATATPSAYFDSAPDSGYSVDNLAPAAPAGVSVAYVWSNPGNTVNWNPAVEPDVAYFNVYRATAPGTDPSTMDLVSSAAGSPWVDPDAHMVQQFYAVSAVDFAGNESPLGSAGTVTAAAPSVPTEFVLHECQPNPFNPTTEITFDLPRQSRVQLRIYDISGRLVRTLVERNLPAGQHTARWFGRDVASRPVASGVYLYRMDAAGFSQTRKMLLLK